MFNSSVSHIHTKTPSNSLYESTSNYNVQPDHAATSDISYNSSRNATEADVGNIIASRNSTRWSIYTTEENDQQIEKFLSSNIAKELFKQEDLAYLSQSNTITKSMLSGDIFRNGYNDEAFLFLKKLIEAFLSKECVRGKPLEAIEALYFELTINKSIKAEDLEKIGISTSFLMNYPRDSGISYILMHMDLLFSKKIEPSKSFEELKPSIYLKNDDKLLEACLEYYTGGKKNYKPIEKILSFCKVFAGKRNEFINPLFLPILFDDKDTLRKMLDASIEPDWMWPNSSVQDLFSYSDRFPALTKFKHELDINLEFDDKKSDNQEESPLAFTLRHKLFSYSAILLEYGADAKTILEDAFNNLPDGNNYEFITLVEFLRWAVDEQDDVLEKILTALHNIDFKNGVDRFGQLIFLLACSEQRNFLEAILNVIKKIKIEERLNLVFLAVFLSQEVLLKKVLEIGFDPNILDHQSDRFPLHRAAELNHYPMVDLLIKHKAQVNLQTGFGLTPLNFAILRNRSDIIERLLNPETTAEEKADPNLGSSLESHELDAIKSMDDELHRLRLANSFASLTLSDNLSRFLQSRGIKLDHSITEQYEELDMIQNELFGIQAGNSLEIAIKKYELALKKKDSIKEEGYRKTIDALLRDNASVRPGHPILTHPQHSLFEKFKKEEK